ncbi:TonB-dependent receptor [Shewanella sp. JNE10-2]|uniref:TonB-dependent receptor n=1 Tax=unclassified Shewanella TaxID=196818 RepID=UPI002005F773|nr:MULTISPECIES: TonB-dependent receptor [unclassified Shewanella]MCK7628382.1 TonB-dependent receptor [Shewanella sp. JNE9-1]MCK7632511.1 TonB-dependent receptor [Shewanella sp. JNE17]MCK7643631.1 TonB-dependent receptor [Shewanella sp. JNE3-1]MCK7648023.1 TonB-dependent receptor [Shewanella sp. JNE8]MCK7651685.1 TonB-dependent receptor [Shewanella sp. JNE4-1]
MKSFRLSLTALACLSALSQTSYAEANSVSANSEANIERITVYGRQNSVVKNSGLATKSDMSLMETPAAVVIVDQDLIETQGTDNLQDLIRNISGVTQAGNNYGIGDNIVIRGLGANYTYDGMYGGAGLGNTFNPTRSLTNVESVEVLKGPATGLYGMGSAGGVINLIEKKPQFESKNKFIAEVGQWDTYSLALDSTGGLTNDVAYRLVAKTARSDGYRDIGTDRDEMYGALKWVLTDSQDLMLSGAYIKDAIAVDSIGHPIRIYNADSVGGKTAGEVTWQDLINDPSGKGLQLTDEQRQQLAASLSSGDGLTPYSFGDAGLISPMAKDNEGEELRFKLTHNIYFNDNLFLNQQVQYRDYTSGFARQTGAYNYVYWKQGKNPINTEPRAPLVENGVLYPFAARRQEYRKVDADETSWQYFADLRYDFQIGHIDNELLINANYEDRNIRFKQYSIYDADQVFKDKDGKITYQGSLPYIYDIRHPNWGTGKFEDYDPLKTANYNKTVSAWGLGVQHVGYLGYGFTTRIGIAFNEIKQSYEHLGLDPRYSISQSQATPEADTTDNGMTYNLGLTYMPIEDLSFFINHSKGRTAYSVLDAVKDNATNRDDSESISNDLGMRFKAFEDQLLGSLVLFKSSRTNVAYNNPDYTNGILTPNIPVYFYDGSEDTQGVELDLNAHLNDQWRVNLNGMYQDARDKQNPNDIANYDSRQKGVPYVTASAWVTYGANWFALSSPIELSLGAKYVDDRSTHSSSFGIPDGYVPSYTVMDSAISYTADSWKIQFNINNLFNKDYYNKAMFLGGMPGEERNVKLQYSYSF